MVLVIHLVVLINILNEVLGASKGEYCVKTNLRSSNEYVQSFNKFKENLRKFFSFPFQKIEHKRKKIKKAFNNFLTEVATEEESVGGIVDRSGFPVNEAHAEVKSIFIGSNDFKLEYHTVITTDGYKLTLHRIIPIYKNETRIKTNKVALLHHGLLGSSSDWILLGPKKALPYLLLEDGYDVWLANARGSKYSRSHVSKPEDSDEFWEFSFHEIGQFDLSATIDYIRIFSESNSTIDFIGHSMGATALLVLLSSYPSYNDALRSATFLGPLVFMRDVKGPLRVLGQYLNLYGTGSLSFLGETEFMATEEFPQELIDSFCRGDELLCSNNWLLLANGGKEILDVELKILVLRQVPSGGSARTVLHYCQLVTSGQFEMFNWGFEENEKKYGKGTPPLYHLHLVSVPVAMFSSHDDWLSTTSGVLKLFTSLPNVVLHHIIRNNDFSHTDFVWSREAMQVYLKIVDFLNRI